jgi:chitodextrinase
MRPEFLLATLAAAAIAAITTPAPSRAATIPAAHVYHNHMPNFWPFYGVDVVGTYNATAVGQPIRYDYDGQVINLKLAPPPGYTYYLPADLGGAIMPHDDLVSYYSPLAKTGAYQYWPPQVAGEVKNWSGGSGQIHVTMSGAVVNNVNSLENLQNVPGYTNPAWGTTWTNAYTTLPTTNGFRSLDMIHFAGHHVMGPLVGPDYFLKDLIFHGATLSQSYFLGAPYRSSHGFFPTELGFSERLIPTLTKLGVQWSVMGNNHFSRTLKDYPYTTYDPTGDTLISPPNRADLRNTSSVGSWVANQMDHEQQVIVNKFPFASTPHWVRYVDPASGAVSKLAGIPVSQNGSWAEGWDGSTTVDEYMPYVSLEPRQFYVIAHDGDNSSGRSGSLDTWQQGYETTCAGNGYCQGIDEYLLAHPIPASDVQHVQDGSWVDTRDSSSDPTWYHWHLPFCIWNGQFADFNRVTGMNLAPKKNLQGQAEGATVSLEYGWHFLERNFALLQAALNYAKTAEQIWLDNHPAYWSPTTTADQQITYPGNQLNPWMMSFPVKGDPAHDYAGGANPAELAWYFLLPAMDSGFGYYDENQDDDVKPTLSFNNSLAFSRPYVTTNIAQDRTGPSIWWPQRYPYNPGSVNASKAEGWTVQHYSSDFAIYTYGYDVSGISKAQVFVRVHTSQSIDANDDTYKVYDPAKMVGRPSLNINPANVGPWTSVPMKKRPLAPVMNGVDWVPQDKETMQVVSAQAIGDLYYAYLSGYRNQLLDYYVRMTDTVGNVSRSEIQQVYVGAGTYTPISGGSGYQEDPNGTVKGTYPFLSVDTTPPTTPGTPVAGTVTDRSVALTWAASTDDTGVTAYHVFRNGADIAAPAQPAYTDTGLSASTTYRYTVQAWDAAGNKSPRSGLLKVTTKAPDTQPPSAPGQPSASTTGGSASLTWAASTDNDGVAGYQVFRNGAQVGTSVSPAFLDSGLAASTSYVYTVKAFDAAGNVSVASAPVTATTASWQAITMFYLVPAGWTTVDIHFAPNGQSWTTPPGLPMSSACPGWDRYEIDLGTSTGAQVTFNNGQGTWDNNHGANYSVGMGIASVANGVLSSGTNPCTQQGAPVRR